MGERVALCVDEVTCRNPELIGLDGESLESQAWLDVFVSAEEARYVIASDEDITEAWVVSSEDIEPINLAATLKRDRSGLVVELVAFEGCGSLFSRAHTAGLDGVLDRSAFQRRYIEAKGRLGGVSNGAATSGISPVGGKAAVIAPGEAAATEAGFAGANDVAVVSAGQAGARGRVSTRAKHASTAETDALVAPAAIVGVAALSRPRGFVMPVVSGSGGAGKSSVAVTAAFMASRMGYRTLLLDYDLQFGDAAIMAGIERPLAVDVALAHPEQLEEELRKNENPTVFAAPMRLEAAEEAAVGLPKLLDDLAGAFDVIVANTGAAWADYHAALLERSTVALFLVDQRSSSLRACRHALELCARCGIATGSFQFAVNRCRKGAPLSSIDVSCALQGVPVHEIEDGGSEVEEYLGAGAVGELLDTGNAFCASLEKLLKQVLPDAGLRSLERLEPAVEKRGSRWLGRRNGRKRG